MALTYFDTARAYQHGNNERMVGTALGAKRKQIVLSTKSHSPDKASLLRDLDTSLSELKTDYLDIWYLHGKDKPEDVHDDLIEAQQIAQQQGKIRFAWHQHALRPADWRALDSRQEGVFDVVLTAYNFTMDSSMDPGDCGCGQSRDRNCRHESDGGRSPRPPARGCLRTPRMQRDGAMLSALKWVLHKPNVDTTIPSMTDMDQLDENLHAMAGAVLIGRRADAGRASRPDQPVCTAACAASATATCAQGLPVAAMLRILTYADGYGQFALARERFRELSPQHTTVRCADCAECTVHCPHGVRVADCLTRAQDLFA